MSKSIAALGLELKVFEKLGFCRALQEIWGKPFDF
jgi:hypothetical protein